MASVQIQTVTTGLPFGPGHLVIAGTRLYEAFNDGTNLLYRYSDDDGATWAVAVTIFAGGMMCSAFYDATNNRMNFAYCAGNTSNGALNFRAITSNVTSGTPGALTTETVVDAGGTNLGVSWCYAVHTNTASNPRYWIGASKFTAASTQETRLWYAPAGASADTGANWTALADVMSFSGSDSDKQPVMQWWQIAGAEKLTALSFARPAVASLRAVTFDPTAASPAVGTVTTGLMPIAAGSPVDFFNEAQQIAISGYADLLVFGRGDDPAGLWGWYYSTNGTAWTAVTNGSITSGRSAIAKSGNNFYIIHAATWGVAGSTAQALSYRLLTASTKTLGAAVAFSDTNGNPVTVLADTGTTTLYCVYRGSTGSPYTLRFDSVPLVGAGDPRAAIRRSRGTSW